MLCEPVCYLSFLLLLTDKSFQIMSDFQRFSDILSSLDSDFHSKLSSCSVYTIPGGNNSEIILRVITNLLLHLSRKSYLYFYNQ